LSACTPAAPAQPTTLTVFAASSLTDAYNEIGTAFSADHPDVTVQFNFAGSQQLRTQLEQGAIADVFASANTKEMNTAITSNLIVSGTQQTFLHNRLIVILPKNNPAAIQSLQDLAKPKLKIILAAPAVPVGGYALTALDKMNVEFGATFSMTVVANVVSYEDNVKQVVAKIQLGEGDAGIVYSSDVTPAAAPQLSTIDIPDKYNVLATYPIAVLKAAPHSQAATAFVEYVLSDKGQSILQKWGFLPK
ncbi:MAG TPA: molybdate ABC transporter substrate-binding protein, partial [Anaerolineae bacterium]|nr:molybdate ABC transporter substrate-binding protein [Anaerolineae bacterium]